MGIDVSPDTLTLESGPTDLWTGSSGEIKVLPVVTARRAVQ
jgi:hypothetical protein